MIKTKKQMFIVISAFILVMLLGTVTYAFFNYTRTGVSNTIKVGRINFVTRELDTINLTNVFPISSSEATGENPNYDEVVIEIVGDTDYINGIEYLVSAVDANIYTTEGKMVPISLDVRIDDDLGTENNNYFTVRENTNTSIYKRIVGDTLVGNQMLLVGYIAPNSVSGTPDGIDATVTIKAYLDKDKILVSDTYDGTESDNMGTTNNQAEGKIVITTNEWNALQQSGVSFKVKVEANEGIWVIGSLEEIMKKNNIGIDTENGVDFSQTSEQDGTLGVYMRAGTENDSYPIMYYRGAVENNNVVFANKCWKAVRTTDTGGVKLIYNGLFTASLKSNDYIIDTENTDSRWTFDTSDNTWNVVINDNTYSAIEFNVIEGENYNISVTGSTGNSCGGSFVISENNSGLTGTNSGGGAAINLKYDFMSLTSTDKLKVSFSGSSSETCNITMKVQMTKPTLDKTDGICVKSGSDTNISIVDSNTKINTFLFNNDKSLPLYNGYMYGDVYESKIYNNVDSSILFGTDYSYDGMTYTLANPSNNHPEGKHYTCFNSTGTCDSIKYVYYLQTGANKYNYHYIELTNNDRIEDALNKMYSNITSSNAKNVIDSWYENNLLNYTNKIEDTIYCNDREISKYYGWDPNYSKTMDSYNADSWGSMIYRPYDTTLPYFECRYKRDSFTVNNNNGNRKLTYPIALLTSNEAWFAGSRYDRDADSYLVSGASYWTMTPDGFSSNGSNMAALTSYGRLYSNDTTYQNNGLRPVISIKPGQLIIKGTGTIEDPYVIE